MLKPFTQNFTPYLLPMLEKIDKIYMNNKIHSTLALNLSTLLGKLGFYHTDSIVEHMPKFMKRIFIGFIYCKKEDADVLEAMKGVNCLILKNPLLATQVQKPP